MTSLEIATITFIIGLSGYGLTTIISNFLHKFAKTYSFYIFDKDNEIIVKNNRTINLLNTIGHLFLYSLLTFIVASNTNKTNIYLQLSLIYSICLVVVSIEYYYRNKFIIVIDKKKQYLKTKDCEYSLNVFSEFEISDRGFWLTDDFDSYGLYLKSADNKAKLIYGYSILTDIQHLKSEIETRLNSR